MQINLDGLMLADYTITVGLAHGRIPLSISIHSKDELLRAKAEGSLSQAGLKHYLQGNRICVCLSGYPVEALAERIAAAMEAECHTVTRQIVEPCSIEYKPIQSFILF